ncbi:MAG: hypothetical protein K2Y22_14220 [Candidatus Obscuribacterales bacterium]|nr:hypothetical protein [Candidatus Obscuribacterales bacterium]
MIALICALIAASCGHPYVAAFLAAFTSFATNDQLAHCWRWVHSLNGEVNKLNTKITEEQNLRKSLERKVSVQQSKITSLQTELSTVRAKNKNARTLKLSLSSFQ